MNDRRDADFERDLGVRLRAHLDRAVGQFDAQGVVDGLERYSPVARRRWPALLALAATVAAAGLLTIAVLRVVAPLSPKPSRMPAASTTPSRSPVVGSEAVDDWGEVATGGVWVRRGQALDISTNDGASWVQASVDPKAKPIFVLDTAHIWSVTLAGGSTDDTDPLGSRKLIVNWTADAGRTWHAVPIPGDYPAMQPVLSFPDAKDGFLVLARGRFSIKASAVFRTNDGGITWTQIGSAPSLGPRLVALHGLRLFAGNAPSTAPVKVWPFLSVSSDGGATWQEARTGAGDESLLLATPRFFERTGVLVVLDPSGIRIFQSSDGGVTWQRLSASVACGDGLATASLPGPTDWFVADPNCRAISITHDGGDSWQQVVPRGLSGSIEWISFTDATHGAAIVSRGVLSSPANVYLTADGGRTWSLARLP